MNKNELTARVRAALEDWEYPCEEIESQPGLQWFQPLSDDYENDYALGELFFASDLTDEDMNGLEIVQCNLVFQRDLPAGAADALRALLAPVNRQISGGRFDVQAEESCFVEYGHDLVLPADLDDDRAAAVVLGALDLANAYIHMVYEAVTAVASGDSTPRPPWSSSAAANRPAQKGAARIPILLGCGRLFAVRRKAGFSGKRKTPIARAPRGKNYTMKGLISARRSSQSFS